MTGQREKSGGKPVTFNDIKDFNDMIAKTGLMTSAAAVGETTNSNITRTVPPTATLLSTTRTMVFSSSRLERRGLKTGTTPLRD